MPDANRSLAESILALFAGRQRAAAIYGDLLELTATSTRTSFWAGYFRTLLSLGWRPLTAFFAAAILIAVLYDSQGLGLFLFAIAYPHLGSPLADIVLLLWFLVPFAAVRYGLRDRSVQLAFAGSVASTSGFVLGCWFSIPEIWVALMVFAAVCMAASTPWRRSQVPVAVSCAVGVAILESLDRIGYFSWAIPGWQQLAVPLVMLMVAVVFSRLHHRLLSHQPAGGVHA